MKVSLVLTLVLASSLATATKLKWLPAPDHVEQCLYPDNPNMGVPCEGSFGCALQDGKPVCVDLLAKDQVCNDEKGCYCKTTNEMTEEAHFYCKKDETCRIGLTHGICAAAEITNGQTCEAENCLCMAGPNKDSKIASHQAIMCQNGDICQDYANGPFCGKKSITYAQDCDQAAGECICARNQEPKMEFGINCAAGQKCTSLKKSIFMAAVCVDPKLIVLPFQICSESECHCHHTEKLDEGGLLIYFGNHCVFNPESGFMEAANSKIGPDAVCGGQTCVCEFVGQEQNDVQQIRVTSGKKCVLFKNKLEAVDKTIGPWERCEHHGSCICEDPAKPDAGQVLCGSLEVCDGRDGTLKCTVIGAMAPKEICRNDECLCEETKNLVCKKDEYCFVSKDGQHQACVTKILKINDVCEEAEGCPCGIELSDRLTDTETCDKGQICTMSGLSQNKAACVDERVEFNQLSTKKLIDCYGKGPAEKDTNIYATVCEMEAPGYCIFNIMEGAPQCVVGDKISHKEVCKVDVCVCAVDGGKGDLMLVKKNQICFTSVTHNFHRAEDWHPSWDAFRCKDANKCLCALTFGKPDLDNPKFCEKGEYCIKSYGGPVCQKPLARGANPQNNYAQTDAGVVCVLETLADPDDDLPKFVKTQKKDEFIPDEDLVIDWRRCPKDHACQVHGSALFCKENPENKVKDNIVDQEVCFNRRVGCICNVGSKTKECVASTTCINKDGKPSCDEKKETGYEIPPGSKYHCGDASNGVWDKPQPGFCVFGRMYNSVTEKNSYPEEMLMDYEMIAARDAQFKRLKGIVETSESFGRVARRTEIDEGLSSYV